MVEAALLALASRLFGTRHCAASSSARGDGDRPNVPGCGHAHGSLQLSSPKSARDGPRGRLRQRGKPRAQLALADSSEALRDIRTRSPGWRRGGDRLAAAAVHVPKPGRSGARDRASLICSARRRRDDCAVIPPLLDRPEGGGHGGSRNPGRWVTVNTPAGSQRVPIRLHVRRFTLPAVPSLKLAFAFQTSWMDAYYGKRLTADEIHAAQDVMLEHRLGPVPMWSRGTELFGNEQRLKECLERGLNVVLLTCGRHRRSDRKVVGRAGAEDLASQAAGALDRAYLFGYDEILVSAPERIPAMRWPMSDSTSDIPRSSGSIRANPTRGCRFVDIFVVPTWQFMRPMAEGKRSGGTRSAPTS